MYYHITWYTDNCVEILSMDKLDYKFISLYEKCIKSNNSILLSGKLLDFHDIKNNLVINTEVDIIEKVMFLEDIESDYYQELKDYFNNVYMKENIINES